MHYWERNATAFEKLQRRLSDELVAATTAARAAGQKDQADALERAHKPVAALGGALSGRLATGRTGTGEAFTEAELAVLAWDALTAGFTALARWRVRQNPPPPPMAA